MNSTASHSWKFYRIGGLDQVAIESAEDLLHLHELDQKLWVALSCPVKGIEIDEQTLALVDTDADGRIRVVELLAAIQWLKPRLKDIGSVLKGVDRVELSNINSATPEGSAILAAAKRILTSHSKIENTSIGLSEAVGSYKVASATKLNGDGIVTFASADTTELATLIGEVLSTQGGEMDRSGIQGISAAKLDSFFKELAAYVAWVDAGQSPSVLVLGEATAKAAAAYKAVFAKVDDFFARCRLLAFDPRAAAALNRPESEYLALSAKDLSASASEFAGLPLSRIEAGASLPLQGTVNPAWAAALTALQSDLVGPLLGGHRSQLSESEWLELKGRISAFLAWQSAKAGASVEKLGVARARDLLGSKLREELAALIARDLILAPEFEAIAAVERLVRYHRDLAMLLRNFVNFFDLYSKEQYSVFQSGTLYLDSRSTELCIRVDSTAAHSAQAPMSKVYVAYVDCRRAGLPPMSIAACFTQGDSDYLFPGRNGVFYDRQGRDWDATITKVVDNPISIGQAFWAPYKRVIRFVEEQIAKRASAADAEATTNLQTTTVSLGTGAAAGKAPPPSAPKSRFDVGTIAALGVAIGGISATLGYVINAFFGLGPWVPLGFVGLVLAVSGPAMVIAWLKLRQRNLGPLLEANGWAINGRVMINIPFGTALTEKAVLPPHARRSLTDPYEDESAKKARRWSVVIFIVLIGLAVALTHQFQVWPFKKAEEPKKVEASAPAVPAETPAAIAPTK